MSIEELQSQINVALKAKDETRVSTLRMLSAAVKNAEIDKRSLAGSAGKKGALTDEEFVDVAKKEAKKRKDAIEAYEKAGSEDRAQAEAAELLILEEFLPAEMEDKDIEKIVEEAIASTNATSMGDMGKVMGAAMNNVKGQASGDRVSEIVKSKLSKSS